MEDDKSNIEPESQDLPKPPNEPLGPKEQDQHRDAGAIHTYVNSGSGG
jgi:hypothetical protein